MKNTAFLFISFLLLTFTTTAQNAKQLDTPEDIGQYGFSILQKLDNISEKEFINSFITFDEIKAFVTELPDSTASKMKGQLKEMSLEMYEERVTTELKKLKETAKQATIDWTKATFLEYTFNKKSEDGVTGIRGKVIFSYKDQKYEARVSAFLIDGKYVPLIVRRLTQHYEEN
jgi:hypothetical protein